MILMKKKRFFKYIFWIYFSLASISFCFIIFLAIDKLPRYYVEFNYEKAEKLFLAQATTFSKEKNSLEDLFNHNEIIFLEFLENQLKYESTWTAPIKFYQIKQDDIEQIKKTIEKLPSVYQEVIENNLLRIYIVDNVRFNGRTFQIGESQQFIIALNIGTFRESPNKWITESFRRIIQENQKNRVEAFLYPKSDDSYMSLVEHILIHEFSHLVGMIKEQNPSYNSNRFYLKKGYYPLIEDLYPIGYVDYEPASNRFDFFNDKSKTVDIKVFKENLKIALELGYPTPYSTRNHNELVAEYLTFYIHNKILKQKFIVKIDNEEIVLANNINYNLIDSLVFR